MFGDEEDLLDQVSSELRGGIPIPALQREGQHTVLRNFSEIVGIFNRKPKHIIKQLSSDLGAKMTQKGEQLHISKQVSAEVVTASLKKYADRFIICPNCGKPDTLLQGNKKKQELQCLSCGQTTPLK